MAPGFGRGASKWVCLACPKNNLDGGMAIVSRGVAQ